VKVGIIGTGGVGGLIGGVLARSGADVGLLARGAHLEAIRRHGLHIEGTVGDFTVEAVASDRGAELGVRDVVFVCVKTFQLEAVLPELRAMLGAHTVVVPLLNGVDAWDRIAAAVGSPHVAGGIVYINSWVAGPGRIGQLGDLRKVVMGEREGGASARLREIATVFDGTAIEVELETAVTVRSWDKFLGFEPMAIVGALSRSSIGTFRSDAGARVVLTTLMDEVVTIARHRGVTLRDDAVARRLAIIDGLAHDATISMQRDLVAGRISELMEQSVALIANAKALGISTPVHDVCVPLLALQEQAARAGGSR
jgi:2-dehydropantoate 2-reductase